MRPLGVGWRCPKLRSAYLGFSGVSPLRGFLRLCRWGVSSPQVALRLHAVMAVPQLCGCADRLLRRQIGDYAVCIIRFE